jgi:hypothetical protein
MTQPGINDSAPDVGVIDGRGRHATLSTYWKEQPAVAVFLRHYG